MYGGFYVMGSGTHQGVGYGAGPTLQPPPPPQRRYGPQQPPLRMQACLRGPGTYASPGYLRQAVGDSVSDRLSRNPSFVLMEDQSSFGQPSAMMQRVGSFNSMGSMGMISHWNSFRPPSGNSGPAERRGSFSSFGSGAGSLHRVRSGMNFSYPTGSQLGWGGSLMRRNSYGSVRQGGPSFFAGSAPARGGGDQPSPPQLNRKNSSVSPYSYGSYRQPSFTHGSVHNGATGVGPELSLNSINGMFQHTNSGHNNAGGSSVVAAVPEGIRPDGGMEDPLESSTLRVARHNSSNSLQRSYSIAGQFFNYGSGNSSVVGDNPSASFPPFQRRLSQHMPGGGPVVGGGAGMVTLSALTATVGYPSGAGAMTPQMHRHAVLQQQQRVSGVGYSGGSTASHAQPSRGTSEVPAVTEGQLQTLGRKSSMQNLPRKNSEKRVGMYFKNKEATEQDGLQYKKDGDPGTSGKSGSNTRDPSLSSTLKASLLLDMSAGPNSAIEVDGRTIRADKPGAEEVQKYDMRDIIYVNCNTDIELSSDSTEEIRDNFVYGCNVGMIMADAGCPAARPTEWFTWLLLKSVVKGTFGKLASVQFEFTMSMCLLQDDQVMDLLSDSPQHFVTLTVAESPLFGNVANGMVYVCVEDAGEFNDVLDASLLRAQEQCSPSAEEQGIVLCTCVLKQIKTSPSSGKADIMISSIFASGVGDGVIHYNRILDKNPAEPRALFYSVLHRSVHSTAFFSCAMNDDEIFNYLATLQRFSKVETRRPKVGSVRAFVAYGTSTIPKIREDLKKTRDCRHRIMLGRQLEKLELMVADAKDMLESPADCVPKTYI